ncbi:hypothetical protein PINS_up018187 [Pythium insidiosum]|nr:hypothetical protein PINS_up017464 [Pythium insidiosum]GLE07586.1 hypothetical protein PINS_up018187 [Pythium insidiosum]
MAVEEGDDYYDVDDDYDDDAREDASVRKAVYPPRLMVDFNSLGMTALLRYAQFYQLSVRDDCGKDELAAVVARHFDCSLEVEEDESIVSFMARVRNGEKSVVRHRPPEKDRKNSEKKRKKSNSRKRQRLEAANGTTASGSSSANGSSGSAATHAADRSGSEKTSDRHSAREHHDADTRKASSSHHASSSSSAAPSSGPSTSAPSSSSSSSSSASSSSHGSSKSSKKSSSSSSDSKKDNDNGEDNELYCVCKMPSYGNMIACDGKKCPNPSQWYHLECVGFSDGRHPDTWLCPECDPKGFADFKSKKKKAKVRSKSPATK